MERIVEMASAEIGEMREIARGYAGELKEIDGVNSCILFGSVAGGTADLKSDIDVLILVDEVERIEDEVNLITDRVSSERSVQIMPDVIKKSKFKKMIEHDADFPRRIREEGIILYEAGENE